MTCAECGKPLDYVPHPSMLAPFFCKAAWVHRRQTGCYVRWWARMAKRQLSGS